MRFRVLSSMLALPLLAGTVFSQDHAIRWAEGAPNATSEMNNGAKVEGLKTGDADVMVNMTELKDTEFNRVWVQVANHSKAPVDFDPQSAILINSDKDKTVRAEIPDKAAHSIEKFGEAKSQELSSAHCNQLFASQCQPTNAQMQLSKEVLAFTAQQGQWVRENGFKKKTINPGNEEQGAIVFRKDKKAANYILRVQVGNQIFEFPLTAPNKEPSYD